MSRTDIVKYEFDQYPGKAGHCLVREEACGYGCDSVVVQVEGKEHVLVGADRDQCGTWVSLGGHMVAQEDGTRSFLDGLIRCLQVLRERQEFEGKDATKIETPSSRES